MNSEQIFFQDGNVHVTSTRFIVESKTYAISAVTSVASSVVAPNTDGYRMTLAGGVLCLVLTLFMVVSAGFSIEASGCIVGGLLVGAILIPVGWLGIKRGKSTYIVTLATSAGEVQALSSFDPSYIERVVKALNQAIVARG